MRKRQLSRSRGPTCSRCVSRTSKAVARENQPSKAPGDLLAPSAHLGSWGQEQSRLRLRRQALREQSEVARRESGKEGVWCGLVVHAPKLIAQRPAQHQPFSRFFARPAGVTPCAASAMRPGAMTTRLYVTGAQLAHIESGKAVPLSSSHAAKRASWTVSSWAAGCDWRRRLWYQ